MITMVVSHLFTHMIWVYFLHLNFQHMKMHSPLKERSLIFLDVFCGFVCFPIQIMCPGFGGACVILATSHCHSVSFCIVLCVVLALNSQAIQSKACISVAKHEHSPFFWKVCQNCFQIIFTENEMRWKRTDGESAKAVREQVFLSRYKSEPGIVEPSVSKSSAYYWYCCLDF